MSIYEDLDDQGSHADWLERCRRDFDATGDPLYAWEAWGIVRFSWRSQFHESLELPEWLASYLDACGHRLLGWKPERAETRPGHWDSVPEDVPPKRGKGPGGIGRAVGFSEGLELARKQWGGQFDGDEHFALAMVRFMYREGVSLDRAAGEAEHARHKSRRSARRAVEGAQRFALRWMQDRLREESGSVPERAKVVTAYSAYCKTRSR